MSVFLIAFKTFCLTVWSYPGVQFIAEGVILNFLVALAVAISTKDFSLQPMSDFLLKHLIPYVLVYFGLSLFGDSVGMGLVQPIVFSLISATILSKLVQNLIALGITIPGPIGSAFTALSIVKVGNVLMALTRSKA